jgi:predicted negative regulator of RcsB-dependent stress response
MANESSKKQTLVKLAIGIVLLALIGVGLYFWHDYSERKEEQRVAAEAFEEQIRHAEMLKEKVDKINETAEKMYHGE